MKFLDGLGQTLPVVRLINNVSGKPYMENFMTIIAVITIFAIIIGPILAVQVDRYLARNRDEKERRLGVFKTLMVTRGAVLSPAHVGALNSIDIEFNSKNEKDVNVRNAWKAYLDQLEHFPKEKDATEEDQKRWKEKTDELLVELLYVMAKAIDYDFDKTYIKRTAYTPVKHADIELEQDFIRRGMVNLLLGKGSIPIEIRTSTENGEVSSEEKLRQLLIEHYEGNKPIRVIIESDHKGDK